MSACPRSGPGGPPGLSAGSRARRGSAAATPAPGSAIGDGGVAARSRDRRGGRLGAPAGRAHARGGDPSRRSFQGRRPVRLRRVWPGTAASPTCALRRFSAASTSWSQRRPAALDRRPLSEAARGMNVAVLASGAGTNLQALIDHAHGRDGVGFVAVASDKPRPGRSSARDRAGIATGVFAAGDFPDRQTPRSRHRRLAAASEVPNWWSWPATCSCSATSSWPPSRTASSTSIRRCCRPSRVSDAVQQAIDYGVKVFGVTVFFVDGGVDTGPVLLQRALELPAARPGRRGPRAPARDRARSAPRGGAG